MSFGKTFARCLWGKRCRTSDIHFPLFIFSKTLTPFRDAKFSFNICIRFFFLFFHYAPFPTETSSKAMDSWFVYQNIDLFSLYTSTLALLLVHFFSFSPLPRAPLMGHPYLDINLPAKRSLAARGTRERWGSIHLGFLVPNWQCRPLC